MPRAALVDLGAFEFSEFERGILGCLEGLKGFPRFALANALVHLGKAYVLAPIDMEMAVFRAITAEEEAATSLILVLRQRRYRNAKKLKFDRHVHKLGLNEFIEVIRAHLSSLRGVPNVRLKRKLVRDSKRMTLEIQVGSAWLEPVPPLNLQSRDDTTKQVYFFSREVAARLARDGAKSLKDSLRKIADTRNQILYACERGRPEVVSTDLEQVLGVVRSRVFRFAILIALLFPYRKRAPFVQQAIDAFLKSVEGIEVEMDYWESPPDIA